MTINKMLGSVLFAVGLAVGVSQADDSNYSAGNQACHHGDMRVQTDVSKDLAQENLLNRFADLHREIMGQALAAPNQQPVYAQSESETVARTLSR